MRPQKYDQDIAFRLCDYVANGMSVEQACRQPKMPAPSTFYLWIGRHPEFRMAYESAFRVRFGLTSAQLGEAHAAFDRRIKAAWRDDRMLTNAEATDAIEGAMRASEQTLARAIRRNRDRRGRKEAKAWASNIIATIQAGDGEALYRIGTMEGLDGAWRLVFDSISKGNIAEISPEVKEKFKQLWLEHGRWPRIINNPEMLCRALRRLMPAYHGPAVMLYRGATLLGWRCGMSWTADIEVAWTFADPPLGVVVKALAQPEAIICKIEYQAPYTEQQKAELRSQHANYQFVEFHTELEYLVDPERIATFEIIERPNSP